MIVFDYSTIIDPWLKDVRTSAIKLSGIKAGDKILDVCCGTGNQVFYYAREGAISQGIDLDPNMIKIAKRNKKKSGLNNASFQVGDAQNLPFEDNFFDCASISLGLHEKERKERDNIISEMKRVTKRGGNLIFIDFRVPSVRNLYFYLIKTIEYFAGRSHYKYFKDYLEQGGLNKILEKNKLNIEKREYTKNGVIDMIKAINQKNENLC